MLKQLLVLFETHKRTVKNILLFVVSLVAVMALSFGLLQVVYHPGEFVVHVVAVIRHAWAKLPGLEVFGLTYSPTLVIAFSLMFWVVVTDRLAWMRFKHFCVTVWNDFWGFVSLTFFIAIGMLVMFGMLYNDMKNGTSTQSILYDLFGVQMGVFLFIKSVRRTTLPWMRRRFDRYNYVLDAEDELKQGIRVKRNKRVLAAYERQKKGVLPWQKPSLH